MKPRILNFKAENPEVESDLFGKKQFHGFKNRNSKEFSLQNLSELPLIKDHGYREPYSLRNSPLPLGSPPRSRPKYETPRRVLEYNPKALNNRLMKLDEIRKKINLKIFEVKKNPEINDVPRKFVPPPLRKISPEKFLESITYSRADLNIASKFIPTDRNTNKLLEENMYRPTFRSPMYTKNSPKIQFTRPIV